LFKKTPIFFFHPFAYVLELTYTNAVVLPLYNSARPNFKKEWKSMDFFLSPLLDTIVLYTAITNFVCGSFLLITCRFIPNSKLTRGLMEKNWYKPLFKFHSRVWWIFGPSFFIHAALAFTHVMLGG
jgi:hypothetical protein